MFESNEYLYPNRIQILFSLALLGLTACGDSSVTDEPEQIAPVEEQEPLAYTPDSMGAWQVGVTELTGVGPDGEDSSLLVWYPSQADDGAAYSYLGAFASGAKELSTPDCSEMRKFVVYSHGNGGLNLQAPFLTEYLASHGYVVVGVNHLENNVLNMVDEALNRVMFRRPVEVSMAFDSVVAQLGQADGLLSGCINEADGFGVVGHSFGGYTSLVVAGASIDPVATQEMCDLGYSWLCNGVSQWGAENPGSVFTWNDERVWATAPMAPCGFEALVGGLQDITVPTLVLGGGMDQTCNIEYQIEAIYSKLKTPVRYMGVLPEGGHQAFSSVCEFGLDYQDCAPPFGNREMLHNRVRSTVLSFFGSARGDKRYNPWLNGVAGEMEWTQP